jgi:hypothetical protein
MTTSGAGTDRAAIWFARYPAPDGGGVFVGTVGPGFPVGTVVELPGPATRPAGWQLEVHAPVPGRLPSRVLVSQTAAPAAPHLWAVVLPAGEGDQVDLVAFSSTAFADGTVVDRSRLDPATTRWGDQVGALRWSPGSGVVRQVYVHPAHRRRRVGTKMAVLAIGVQTAMGWTPLRSDGRLTDLGDAWLQRSPDWWRENLAPRTADLPPMTPPADTSGIPLRNLEPDAGS